MKSNKEYVYDFIINYCNSNVGTKGISTLEIANKLSLQRTNLSTILNQLVSEGLIKKDNGRPVLYSIVSKKEKTGSDYSCFNVCIAHDGALKNSIQLAKAAILYPNKMMHTLVIGESGVGKSFFTKLMFEFAKETNTVSKEAKLIKINCRNYVDDPDYLAKALFGRSSNQENLFEQANDSILIIDHVELLPAYLRNNLIRYIETGEYQSSDSSDYFSVNTQLICISSDVNSEILKHLKSKIPMNIILPSLSQYSIKERLDLVKYLFSIESLRIKKKLTLGPSIMRCLLLYDASMNIKQLSYDIQVGCSKAYLRYFEQSSDEIELHLSDFAHYVRKGFLNYTENKNLVESLVPANHSHSFNGSEIIINEVVEKHIKSNNVYDFVTSKIIDMKELGMKNEDISTIINIETKQLFNSFKKQYDDNNVINKKQLSKVVDKELIKIVENFLKDAKTKFNKEYSASVFYGLCFHLDGAIKRGSAVNSSIDFLSIVDENKEEYALSLQLVGIVEKKFKVKLPAQEAVFVSIFLKKDEKLYEESNPVVLVIMHGSETARGIANTVNTLLKLNNTFYYDMDLEKSSKTSYKEIKDLILNIDEGKGVLVIYDMGSIKNIIEVIQGEVNNKIRMIYFPITLLALEASRKASLIDNIDQLFVETHNSLIDVMPLSVKSEQQYCYITLCNTGEGGALQVKEYIFKNLGDEPVIFAVAQSDITVLTNYIKKISETYKVKAIIGTKDPEIMGIGFISIAKVMAHEGNDLKRILNFEEVKEKEVNYAEIYDYLEEQLEYIDIEKIKKHLPKLLFNLEKLVPDFTKDQNLGLFIHIACAINRMAGKLSLPISLQKDSIFKKYGDLCKQIIKLLKPIEKSFNIIFSDDEIAHVVAILKKI